MTEIICSGFGGQGVLSAGMILADAGMEDGKNVTWYPSYGSEMRGGTANCNVILSDTPVGSPIITEPDVLIAMNLPSLQKYIDTVVPGGQIYVDSALIGEKVARTDVDVFYVPATKIAHDAGIGSLANMILVGHLLEHHPELCFDGAEAALRKLVPEKKAAMIDMNLKALCIVKDYTA